jgi:hypothetical protein
VKGRGARTGYRGARRVDERAPETIQVHSASWEDTDRSNILSLHERRKCTHEAGRVEYGTFPGIEERMV